MKEKILIVFVAIILLAVLAVRLKFHSNLSEFETSVKFYEMEQLHRFEKDLADKQRTIKASGENIYNLFIKQFAMPSAIEERDTVYKFLYLKESIKFKKPLPHYLDCLYKKCIIDEHNDRTLNIIGQKSRRLKNKFEDKFDLWYSRLGEDKIFDKNVKLTECLNATKDVYEINFDEKKWRDFERLLISYNKEVQLAELKNKKVLNELENLEASVKKQLNRNASQYFNNLLINQKSNLLLTQTDSRSFNNQSFGPVNYSIEKLSINRNAFQNIVDAAFEEQWKTNSLNNGSMPYSYCYGSNNYCSDYGCSQIKVISGSSDVLVTIKKSYGNVYRHAYVKAGISFTFNVTDGSYQVFFYSGRGWNPNKVITTSSCGNLKGGFVSNESVTKDSYLSIYNQIMTYELISQQGGNFSAQASSKNEAF